MQHLLTLLQHPGALDTCAITWRCLFFDYTTTVAANDEHAAQVEWMPAWSVPSRFYSSTTLCVLACLFVFVFLLLSFLVVVGSCALPALHLLPPPSWCGALPDRKWIKSWGRITNDSCLSYLYILCALVVSGGSWRTTLLSVYTQPLVQFCV